MRNKLLTLFLRFGSFYVFYSMFFLAVRLIPQGQGDYRGKEYWSIMATIDDSPYLLGALVKFDDIVLGYETSRALQTFASLFFGFIVYYIFFAISKFLIFMFIKDKNYVSFFADNWSLIGNMVFSQIEIFLSWGSGLTSKNFVTLIQISALGFITMNLSKIIFFSSQLNYAPHFIVAIIFLQSLLLLSVIHIFLNPDLVSKNVFGASEPIRFSLKIVPLLKMSLASTAAIYVYKISHAILFSMSKGLFAAHQCLDLGFQPSIANEFVSSLLKIFFDAIPSCIIASSFVFHESYAWDMIIALNVDELLKNKLSFSIFNFTNINAFFLQMSALIFLTKLRFAYILKVVTLSFLIATLTRILIILAIFGDFF